MKKVIRFLSLSLLTVSALSLMGCGSKKTIKNKQAQQILLMILDTQVNNTEFVTEYEKRGEISYKYTGTNGDFTIELSLSNKILHRYSASEDVPDTWYYMNEGILYRSTVDKEGNVITSYRDGGDEESYAKDFDTYFVNYKSEMMRLIKEVDKPLAFQEELEIIDEMNKDKVKSKFSTTKDGNLNANISIYNDVAKKNLNSQYSFVYEGNVLMTHNYKNESEGVDNNYTISYATQLTKEVMDQALGKKE